jgi:hypothetical protein
MATDAKNFKIARMLINLNPPLIHITCLLNVPKIMFDWKLIIYMKIFIYNLIKVGFITGLIWLEI